MEIFSWNTVKGNSKRSAKKPLNSVKKLSTLMLLAVCMFLTMALAFFKKRLQQQRGCLKLSLGIGVNGDISARFHSSSRNNTIALKHSSPGNFHITYNQEALCSFTCSWICRNMYCYVLHALSMNHIFARPEVFNVRAKIYDSGEYLQPDYVWTNSKPDLWYWSLGDYNFPVDRDQYNWMICTLSIR